jgi:hypothetical protein
MVEPGKQIARTMTVSTVTAILESYPFLPLPAPGKIHNLWRKPIPDEVGLSQIGRIPEL